MFSWLIPSGPFINKCLRTETGIDVCAYFINETRQYGKFLYSIIIYTETYRFSIYIKQCLEIHLITATTSLDIIYSCKLLIYVKMFSYLHCVFIKDSWEESQSTIHMALREAISRGDVGTTKTILSELGSKEEYIVNMAPNGTTTLLYWY